MAIKKTVSFNGVYAGSTFQALTRLISGADGYISGAVVTESGTATVGPYAFLQRGIIVEQDANTTGLVLPTAAEPWFLMASTPDDDIASGATLNITTDVSLLGTGVVLAFKANGTWQNPVPVTVRAAATRAGADVGREAGLTLWPTVSANNMTAVNVNRGRVVDPDGVRRELSATGQAALELTASTFRPHEIWDRNDYLVLRQRESATPTVQLLIGNTVGTLPDPTVTSVILETGAGVKRPSAFAKRGGAKIEKWFAWGNASALRVQSAGGGFGPITIGGAAATVDNTWIAGIRTGDGAVILLYTEGNVVKLLSFNPTTGAVIDGPTRIDTQTNACIRVRGVIGADGYLHVVYQHNEGGAPPNQQIYYTKVAITAGAGFAVAGTSPRIANGSNSAKNDTWPSVGVDRKRQVHIAYSSGAGSDEFGDLRYIVFDQNGTRLTNTVFNSFGGQTTDSLATGIVSLAGTVANSTTPCVVVTPHDEVYILSVLINVGGSKVNIGVASPSFAARLNGFNNIRVQGMGPGTDLKYVTGFADEHGQLLIATLSAAQNVYVSRIDTAFAPLGVISDSVLDGASGVVFAPASAVEIQMVAGQVGDLTFAYLNGTSATYLPNPVRSGLGGGFRPHPRDVYLGSFLVGTQSVATVVPETEMQVFNTRAKRMNYPFLVGDQGDFQGYYGLYDAVQEANRNGGMIVARGGEQKLVRQLVLQSGVRIVAENVLKIVLGAIVASSTTGALQLGAMAPGTVNVTSISSQTVTCNATLVGVRPGDIVAMETSGLHRIRRVLTGNRVVLDGAAPVGTFLRIYSCGHVLENMVVEGAAVSGGAAVLFSNCYRPRVFGLELTGSFGAIDVAVFNGCRDSMIDDCSFGLTAGSQTSALRLLNGTHNTVRASRFAPQFGMLKIDAGGTEDLNPVLIGNLSADGVSGVTAPYQISGVRTTKVVLIDNEGTLNGVDNAYAKVSKHLNAKDDALVFHDAFTDALGATGLALTAAGGGNASFNGATANTIVPSVNERVKKTGDTMSGNLLVDADGHKLGDSTFRWDANVRTGVIDGAGDAAGTSSLEVKATGGKTAPIIKVTAASLQTGALAKLTGKAGVYSEIDVMGGFSFPGARFFDDFLNVGGTATDAKLWALNAYGNNTGATHVIGAPSTLQAKTGATNGNDIALVTTMIGLSATAGVIFRARFSISTTTNRVDEIGIIGPNLAHSATEPVFALRRDTAISNNWKLIIKNADDSYSAVDPVIPAPTAATYYTVTVMILADLQTPIIGWGTDDKLSGWTNLVTGSALPVPPILAVTNCQGYVYSKTLANVNAELDVDWFEAISPIRG
jgi:hypothetical protein